MLGPTNAQIIFAQIHSMNSIIWNYEIYLCLLKKCEDRKIIKNQGSL